VGQNIVEKRDRHARGEVGQMGLGGKANEKRESIWRPKKHKIGSSGLKRLIRVR